MEERADVNNKEMVDESDDSLFHRLQFRLDGKKICGKHFQKRKGTLP